MLPLTYKYVHLCISKGIVIENLFIEEQNDDAMVMSCLNIDSPCELGCWEEGSL